MLVSPQIVPTMRDTENSLNPTPAPFSGDNSKKSAGYRRALENLTPNVGAEILRYGWAREGTISLGQGEGSRTTPDFIIDAAAQAAKEGKTFYAPVLGIPELRQELSTYYARHYKVSVPTNRIYVTGSGTTAMHLALTAVLDEGDEVIAVTPIWKNLLGAVEVAQGRVRQCPLDFNEGEWSLDLDKLFSMVDSKTKALLLVTPSNPTGWVMRAKDIQEIMNFARRNDIWVIADEVYSRLVYEGTHAPSFLEVAESTDKLFVVNSFSKAWAMTGWRLGWLVGPVCAEERIRDLILYDNLGVANFPQYGGLAALRQGEAFLSDQMNLWRKNRDRMTEFFKDYPQVSYSVPEAGFYSFFKADGQDNCIEFAKRLIDEAGISIAPGKGFGDCCKGWMRLCFAVSEERLEESLNRLDKGFKAIF
ncbi:MAG: pyridoxal phosphate-dependent aminotransferase [Pseudobdellovibrionaceae bacterium]